MTLEMVKLGIMPVWVHVCPKGGRHRPEEDMVYNELVDRPMDVHRCARCGSFVSGREVDILRRLREQKVAEGIPESS